MRVSDLKRKTRPNNLSQTGHDVQDLGRAVQVLVPVLVEVNPDVGEPTKGRRDPGPSKSENACPQQRKNFRRNFSHQKQYFRCEK